MLLATSFVSVLLVPPEAYQKGGPAAGRVIASMTDELMGNAGGSLYDVSTILILWFAGASAMAGMLNLVPRSLPRHWEHNPEEAVRPLIFLMSE